MNILVMKEGIKYCDKNDNEQFIDFALCNKHWLEYRKRTECLNDDQFEIIKKRDTVVGRRVLESEFAYFEFFTKPFTKLSFQTHQHDLFRKLNHDIFENGWSTLDMG